MNEIRCKKCKGKPPRRGNPPCATCKGSGYVTISVDGEGKTVIKPAAR